MGLPTTEDGNVTPTEVTGEDERRWLEPWRFCLPETPWAGLGWKTASTMAGRVETYLYGGCGSATSRRQRQETLTVAVGSTAPLPNCGVGGDDEDDAGEDDVGIWEVQTWAGWRRRVAV
ncbi:hypothetical protein PIB30_005470 [Stylosanthes scabra]|uniref:Uncharacterized protein n=1 Tax=Stylosanthes scabra TaxID=79078 RepID=A0ABU6Z0S6_9FABA|nr:hypothetical protein [Stylosanthes scabra]